VNVGVRDLFRAFLASFEDRVIVEERGMRLLREHLDPEQRAQFNAFDHFEVIGSDSGRRYQIKNLSSINIEQLGNDGRCLQKWCFGPAGGLARGDILLTQKVALESFETEALAVAHSYPPHSQEANRRR
jgi:hypothetical protein